MAAGLLRDNENQPQRELQKYSPTGGFDWDWLENKSRFRKLFQGLGNVFIRMQIKNWDTSREAGERGIEAEKGETVTLLPSDYCARLDTGGFGSSTAIHKAPKPRQHNK